MQRALVRTWKKALKEPRDLTPEEYQDCVDESRDDAKEEIAPTLGVMKGTCENVRHQLDPIRVTLDGLSLGM